MTQAITEEVIKGLPSDQLALVAGWIRAEEKVRADRCKQETLAKIKELARSIKVGVKIDGVRGRPAKARTEH